MLLPHTHTHTHNKTKQKKRREKEMSVINDNVLMRSAVLFPFEKFLNFSPPFVASRCFAAAAAVGPRTSKDLKFFCCLVTCTQQRRCNGFERTHWHCISRWTDEFFVAFCQSINDKKEKKKNKNLNSCACDRSRQELWNKRTRRQLNKHLDAQTNKITREIPVIIMIKVCVMVGWLIENQIKCSLRVN